MPALLMLWLATATFVWQIAPDQQPVQYLMERQVQGAPWQMVGMIDAPEQRWRDLATGRGMNCYRVTARYPAVDSLPSDPVCIKCSVMKCRQ